MSSCPNLRELAGKRYHVSWDKSRLGRERDPWLYVVSGRLGHISPWSQDKLAVWTDRSRALVRKLQSVGCQLVQDGDREWQLVFPSCLFLQVARLIKARRKKRASQSQLDALAQARQARMTAKTPVSAPLLPPEIDAQPSSVLEEP